MLSPRFLIFLVPCFAFVSNLYFRMTYSPLIDQTSTRDNHDPNLVQQSLRKLRQCSRPVIFPDNQLSRVSRSFVSALIAHCTNTNRIKIYSRFVQTKRLTSLQSRSPGFAHPSLKTFEIMLTDDGFSDLLEHVELVSGCSQQIVFPWVEWPRGDTQ